MELSENLVNEINIYCDESGVENPDSRKMVIGCIFIPRDSKKKLTNEINKLKKKHAFHQELKWNKVGEKYQQFYKDLIDLFFSAPELTFRGIVVNKSIIKYDVYHENDEELAFFKFYYLMLKHKLSSYNNYFIFLDRKPTRDKNRARALKAFLDSHVLFYRNSCNIKHLQAYSSSENIQLQIADFFVGLLHSANNSKKQSAKGEIVKYFSQNFDESYLVNGTPLSENKFNIFFWNKKNEVKS